MVDSLIHSAVLAVCDDQEPTIVRVVGRLAATHDAGWRRTVDRALDERLRTTVKDLWRNGWQPVDLFRVIARDGDAAQLRLLRAGVAAELARYAAATVDPRWAAQLAEARAEVWWEPRLSAVRACAEEHGPDRPGFVRDAVHLLHSLAHLPPLDLLGPVPGTAVPAAGAPRASVDERILGRVRAFLAKAESTPYPAEAETFTAAAQAMMARHSIDHALLMAAGRTPSDEPTARRVGVDNPYEAPKVSLLDAIASANRCRTVWNKAFGFVNVIGYPTDLDSVELIFTSLLVQATAAMTREGQRTRRGRTRPQPVLPAVVPARLRGTHPRTPHPGHPGADRVRCGRAGRRPVAAGPQCPQRRRGRRDGTDVPAAPTDVVGADRRRRGLEQRPRRRRPRRPQPGGRPARLTRLPHDLWAIGQSAVVGQSATATGLGRPTARPGRPAEP